MALILFNISINMSLQRRRDSDLTLYCENVLNNISGNTHFVSLHEKVAAAKQLLNNFSEAIVISKDGPAGSTATKNALRQKLELAMKCLAANCIMLSDEDVAVFESTGIKLRNKPTRNLSLLAPSELAAKPLLRSGVVVLSFKRVKGANLYIVQVKNTETNEKWERSATNGRNTLIEGLLSGKVYEFKIYAVGVRGVISTWSNTFSCKVY